MTTGHVAHDVRCTGAGDHTVMPRHDPVGHPWGPLTVIGYRGATDCGAAGHTHDHRYDRTRPPGMSEVGGKADIDFGRLNVCLKPTTDSRQFVQQRLGASYVRRVETLCEPGI